MLRWLGVLRVRSAVLILVAAALLGAVLTLIAGRDPGFLLGFFMIVGTFVAALAVRRGAAYLLFPWPALLLFIAAIMVGSVHDTGLESAGAAGLGAGFTQWVAAVFFPMCVSTILALVIGAARWVLDRQLVTGPPAAARTPANARPAPGRRSPASDPWETGFSSNSPPPSAPRPPRLGANGSGPARDSRADRDPWGDPRIAGNRSQPPTAQPPTAQRPADGPRTAAPRFVPREGTSQPPQTSAPRDPAPRLPRGPRSQPRDPWS